jgi:hypothetical protein
MNAKEITSSPAYLNMADMSVCSRIPTSLPLSFTLLVHFFSRGAGASRVGWALARGRLSMPRGSWSSVFRRFGPPDASTGEGRSEAVESLP